MKTTIILFLLFLAISTNLTQLQRYNIDISDTTISGISSGGAFVQQLAFAHSQDIKGVATISGPPYGCASGNAAIAVTSCMIAPAQISVNNLANQAKILEKQGKIDPLINIGKQKQYFYSGTKDTIVNSGVVLHSQDLVVEFGAQTQDEFSIVGEHAWPTINHVNPCVRLGEPYINKCDYQASNVFMKMFLGGAYKDPVAQKPQNLILFDQTSYIKAGDSMNDRGYVYVPDNCRNGKKCQLHVAFHGCQQTLADIGTDFVNYVGLNELAEANDLVILYPQILKSLIPVNPNGCWDWWGYSINPIFGPLQYLTQDAPQIKAVYHMMQDLSNPNIILE